MGKSTLHSISLVTCTSLFSYIHCRTHKGFHWYMRSNNLKFRGVVLPLRFISTKTRMSWSWCTVSTAAIAVAIPIAHIQCIPPTAAATGRTPIWDVCGSGRHRFLVNCFQRVCRLHELSCRQIIDPLRDKRCDHRLRGSTGELNEDVADLRIPANTVD